MVNSKATFKSKSLHLLIRNIVAIKNLSQQSVQALIFCRILRHLYLEICSEVFMLWNERRMPAVLPSLTEHLLKHAPGAPAIGAATSRTTTG